MKQYDLVVIGGGPGGYVAAIRAAQLGLGCALIEMRAALGGTCLNVGCIPSKALLESSELFAHVASGLDEHGIAAAAPSIDVSKMLARKERIVGELTGGIATLMKKNKIEVYRGRASFVDAHRVRVSGEGEPLELGAHHVIIATGSAPVELPFMPFDGERIISSTEALALPSVPARLLVVGAGAIGLELGSVWARLGATVTVIELFERIVPFADPEMSKVLQRALKKQGLCFELGCGVSGATLSEDGRTVTLRFSTKQGEEKTLSAERVLVAVGRRPYAEGLGLEAVGLGTEKGRIPVDAHCRTALPHIFAIGDVVVGPMLAHKAEEEGVAVAELIAGKAGHVNYEAIPNVVYTWPELAQVGLSEEEAQARGYSTAAGSFRFVANGRAKTLGMTEGLVKIVSDAKTDRILGAHIVGPRASEMIAELTLALEFGASAEDVARTCHAHPTLSEVIKEAALAVDKRALHG